MPLKTPSDYVESIRSLNRTIYMFGQRIENPVDHPIIKPSLNAVAMTYALAQKDEYKEIMTAQSHITGNIINRFTHIHQSIDDLVKKSKMGRLLGSQTGCCFQRCVGMDALNALSMTTYAIDQTYTTNYYQRFLHYLEYIQNNDLVCDGAMTDPKGDRSLPPHKQDDPDVYLRVIKELQDGIIVRGAKAHQTGAINSHEIIVMPTIAMREE
ncbi:MAG TPA: 4-hydroxyphenylacetate 3-hydroxylase N-terminal domain-containing protein, partial [Spirochaetota bacterium]|nr:4-hydroxyphenylacetate 3-hydroxylase N-terminal domain-containing protein [Spirochaetota bacterium]